MRPEDEIAIRIEMIRKPFACRSAPDHVLRVVDLWNEGYSARHISELLGLEDATLIARPLSSVRMRCPSVSVRRVGSHNQALEHPTWWTPDRLERLHGMWLEELSGRIMADRLGTNENTVHTQVKSLGWVRPRMTPKKPEKLGISVREHAAATAKAPQKPVVFQALPGTEPIPFWQVPLRGCCNWILADNRENMADALCCGAPTKAPRDRYCEVHEALGTNASAWGPKLSAKALVRRYANYA